MTRPARQRADLLLVERGLAESRARAQALILAGKVFSGESRIAKAGDLVAVEAMSVNLADGHYLKIGVAIELTEGQDAKYFEKAGKPNKVRDLIITSAASRTMADLATLEGKEKFRAELDKGSEKLYKEYYHGIYFTEFVMQ